MKFTVRYRDPQTGRFAKFQPANQEVIKGRSVFRDPRTGRFIKKPVLSKEVYNGPRGEKLASKTGVWQFKGQGFTGLNIWTKSGKNLKIREGQIYHKGAFFVEGVKLFNLKSRSVLTKNVIDILESLGKKLKIEGRTKLDLKEFLRELYPDSPSLMELIGKGGITTEYLHYDYPVKEKFETDYRQAIYPDKKPRKPLGNFWVLDTEDNSKGSMYLACLVSSTGEKKLFQGNMFEIRERFKEFIRDKKIKLIYAHNLTYDLQNIFYVDEILNSKIFFRHGNIIKMIWKDGKYRCEFRDSFAVLPVSVKKLGSDLNFEKIQDKNRGVDYCIRDCEIVIKALNKLDETLSKLNVSLKLTLPSIFLNLFRKTLNYPVFRSDYIEFVRHAYKGGRTEVFKLGKSENINVYDVNSLYPFCMIGNMPDPDQAYQSFELKPPDECFQVCHCRVKVYENVSIPPLGIRWNNKLVFPVGYFEGFFTNEELYYLEKNGIGEVERPLRYSLIFNWWKPIFRDLILKLYELRNQSTGYEKFIYKIIMNGGYGKFAQDKFIEQYNPDTKVIEAVEKYYPKHSNYIWSIVVTSRARLYLQKFLNMYENNVLYCDTDSIHLSSVELNNKYTGNELGQFKHEGNFEVGIYKGLKMYKLINDSEEIIKCKGIPKNLQKEYFETGKVKFQLPVKLKKYLRYRQLPLNPRELCLNYWEWIEKLNKTTYDKRDVMPDGTTRPLYINIDEEIRAINETLWEPKEYNNLGFRNRCIVCGTFISHWRNFCEFHELNWYDE